MAFALFRSLHIIREISPLTCISFSFIEGIVRGYRNGLLTGANYNNLTQCENIDGKPITPLLQPSGVSHSLTEI